METRPTLVSIAAVIAMCLASSAAVAQTELRGNALLPNRYKCVDLLELQTVSISNGTITFNLADSGSVALATDYKATVSWLQGYFTAQNTYQARTGGDLTGGTKPLEWMAWIFGYCRSNPWATLPEVVLNLGETLTTRGR